MSVPWPLLVTSCFTGDDSESSLWTGSRGDFLLIGFRNGEPNHLTARMIDARGAETPMLYGSDTFLGDSPANSVLSSFILGTGELKEYAGKGKINSDDLPLLEFRAPASLYSRSSYKEMKRDMLWCRKSPIQICN